MSASNKLSDNQVEEYVKMFPLGRTNNQINEKFSQSSTDEIDSILNELVEEGILLKKGSKYHWTG